MLKEGFSPLSLEDLSARHARILGSLEKIKTVTASLDNRLANLDGAQSAEKFISSVLQAGLVTKALEGKAKPTLLVRKKELEEEIGERVGRLRASVDKIIELAREGYLPPSVLGKTQEILRRFTKPENLPEKEGEEDKVLPISQRLDQFFEKHPEPNFFLRDVGEALGFPSYPSNNTIDSRVARWIKDCAHQLGIVVRRPASFSREEVARIVLAIEEGRLFTKAKTESVFPLWAREALENKGPFVFNGREIAIDASGKMTASVLRILLAASKERKAPSFLLRKVVYKDKASSKGAKIGVSNIIRKLRKILANVGVDIISEPIRGENFGRGAEACYCLTALPAKVETIEPENSQQYKLENPLFCDLGRILRAGISQPVLEQFEIKFTPMQISIIDQAIAKLCDQSKKSQFETSDNTGEVFDLLTKSLEGFANLSTRNEFLTQNSITLRTLLLFIGFGKIDTVENLHSLMTKLRGEYSKS